ncbi:MAG: guanylate kinase [Coriobacteriia bacterium]|nr:guanylate kinase [Coriobacteriia bacterium]
MRKGNLFIISGPSGAGKGTLVKELRGRIADLWVSVSMTTRSPRPGEVEGREYSFVSEDAFDRLRAQDGLLEWAEVHGNHYGTPKALVDSKIAEGRQVVLEIDPQGAFQVKTLMPESVLVFVMPPSFDELQRRLVGRGSETESQIAARLATARRELELVGKYDHVVINDDLLRATGELERIIDEYADSKEI